MENIFFIATGIFIVIIFGFIISITYLFKSKDDLDKRWENLLDKLQYRQDLIPNLIETVRCFIPLEKIVLYSDLIDKTIEIRKQSSRLIESSDEKMKNEHFLSEKINDLFDLGNTYPDLGKATNYLELRKDFSEINGKINELSKDYNNNVRKFNKIISGTLNFITAKLLKLKRYLIFEFE